MDRRNFPPRALWNVLLAAFTLRWWGLEKQSLWFDEGVTWAWATQPTLGGTVFAEPNHPPVWWLVTRFWVGLFGDAEQSLRAPAALCGILTVFLAWRLGLRLLDPAHAPRRGGFSRTPDDGSGARHATWFALFVAVAAPFLEVSQEARMYALLTAEGLGLALLYLRWLDRDDRASLVGYGALAALALHTHAFAVWPLAALGLHAALLARRTRALPDGAGRVRLLPFAAANAVAALLFVPWLVFVLRHYRGLALPPDDAPGWQLLHVLRRLGVGPAVALEAPWTWLTDLVWVPALLLGAWGLRGRGGTRSLVLTSLLVPLVGLLALHPVWPFLHERYLVFLAPWLWLLAVLGALRLSGIGRAAVLLGLCGLAGLGAAAYHLGTVHLVPVGVAGTLGSRTPAASMEPDPADPTWVFHRGHPFAKEPWRLAAEFVETFGRDDDLVVLYPGWLRPVWDYQERSKRGGPRSVLELPEGPLDAAALLATHGPLLQSHRRVFLLTSKVSAAAAAAAHAALAEAVRGAWADPEAPPPEILPPIPFRHAWGLSISVFARSR